MGFGCISGLVRAGLCGGVWAVAAGAAGGTNATPYDGRYLPEDYAGGAMSCAASDNPQGITSIAGDEMVTALYGCRLSDPVAVRGMDATLYDAACGVDSEAGGGRVMLTRSGNRLLVNWGQYWELWLKCD